MQNDTLLDNLKGLRDHTAVRVGAYKDLFDYFGKSDPGHRQMEAAIQHLQDSQEFLQDCISEVFKATNPKADE